MHCGCAFASQSVSTRLPFEFKTSVSKVRASSAQLQRTQIQINLSDDVLIDGSGKSPTSRVSLPSHVKSITSTSNPFVKHCLKVRQSSSYRHAHGSVLVVGAIPIREVCMFQTNKQGITTEIECLLLHEEAQIPQGLESQSIRIVRVSSLVMKKLSGVQSTESVEAIALMRIPSSFIDLKDDDDIITDCNKWFPSTHRVLVLDSIQDPGNLGTLIRSAMAFNWDGAFLLPGCCDPFNDKALRASRGASFQLPIVSGNWNHLKILEHEFHMKLLAGHPETTTQKLKPVSRLSQEFAQSLAEKPLCLILGSEGNGLSEQSRKVCELVSIPMAALQPRLKLAAMCSCLASLHMEDETQSAMLLARTLNHPCSCRISESKLQFIQEYYRRSGRGRGIYFALRIFKVTKIYGNCNWIEIFCYQWKWPFPKRNW